MRLELWVSKRFSLCFMSSIWTLRLSISFAFVVTLAIWLAKTSTSAGSYRPGSKALGAAGLARSSLRMSSMTPMTWTISCCMRPTVSLMRAMSWWWPWIML